LASAGDDRNVIIWEPMSAIIIFKLIKHTSFVFCLDYSPDGLELVSGGHDNMLVVWDVQNGKIKNVINGFAS